jgi:SET domain-containing protein
MPLKNDSDTVARTPADTKRRCKRFAVRRSTVHGRGVFATRALAAGEQVCEYRGERISWEEALLRHPRDPAHPDHTFYFDIGDGTVIDGAVDGNSARWINHACRPNCEAEDRNGRIFIQTVQPIRSGEELSIDYALLVEGRYTRQLRHRYACHCGSPDCRGTMLAERRWQIKVTPESMSAPDRLADVANSSAAPHKAAPIVERQSQDALVVA